MIWWLFGWTVAVSNANPIWNFQVPHIDKSQEVDIVFRSALCSMTKTFPVLLIQSIAQDTNTKLCSRTSKNWSSESAGKPQLDLINSTQLTGWDRTGQPFPSNCFISSTNRRADVTWDPDCIRQLDPELNCIPCYQEAVPGSGTSRNNCWIAIYRSNFNAMFANSLAKCARALAAFHAKRASLHAFQLDDPY